MTLLAAAFLAATFTRPMERVSTMDPALATTVYDSHAIQLVYETPLEVDYLARSYRLVPGFCELPETSADGLRYVFRLRQPAAEGGKTGLTAADMVRSLERLRDPAVVSPNGWIVKDVDTVRALDGCTVEIVLKRRCHFFPWLMALSATCVRGADGEGTGPYELVSWRKNHEMVFRRRSEVGGQRSDNGVSDVRPSTFNLQPHFDTVRYLVVDDPSTQWLMLLKGELDFLGNIARDNWDSAVGADGRLDASLVRAGLSLYGIPTMEVMHIGINMRDPVLGSNRKLRQALNAAFDYPVWERFYNGRIEPCTTPVPPGVGGRLETPFAYGFDLAKARILLAEAGYPNGTDPKTGRRLALTLTIGKASQESREAGELMASFYARIGIRLDLAFMTWDAFLKAVNEGRVQMFRMGWVGDYPDAQNFLQLFHSRSASPGPNHANYANPVFDREYDAALDAVTEGERNGHWMKCQEIVREDCPWIFTHVNKAFTLVRSTVRNYRPTDFPYGAEKHYEVAVP